MAGKNGGSGGRPPKPGDRDVVPSKTGAGWDVKKPGIEKPESHHRKQSTAEDAAKGASKRSGGGEVRTHGRDGKIRDSDTMPPARDPNPPKDQKH
jgi:hypothetical protein